MTFTATPFDPAATGTVTFTDGATPFSTVPVVVGAAQVVLMALALSAAFVTLRS